jgi:hypothetical protein
MAGRESGQNRTRGAVVLIYLGFLRAEEMVCPRSRRAAALLPIRPRADPGFLGGTLPLTVLRHRHDRQQPLEQDGARLLRQRVEGRIDEWLHQFGSVGLPQAPAAFHERAAAGSQQRFELFVASPKPRSLETALFIHANFTLNSRVENLIQNKHFTADDDRSYDWPSCKGIA